MSVPKIESNSVGVQNKTTVIFHNPDCSGGEFSSGVMGALTWCGFVAAAFLKDCTEPKRVPLQHIHAFIIIPTSMPIPLGPHTESINSDILAQGQAFVSVVGFHDLLIEDCCDMGTKIDLVVLTGGGFRDGTASGFDCTTCLCLYMW